MTREYQRIHAVFERLEQSAPKDEWRRRLGPSFVPAPPSIRHHRHLTARSVDDRWQTLRAHTSAGEPEQRLLLDDETARLMQSYEHNVENFVGTVKTPVGVAGPLRVNGCFARGDYYVPLATCEAALVASYQRGAALITEAGGAVSVLLGEGVSRAPSFAFATIAQAGEFVSWIIGRFDEIKRVADSTTEHGELLDMFVNLEASHVYVSLEFATGDAAGQNMVTIATAAVCDYVVEHSPVRPEQVLVEANFTGDKKVSALSLIMVRGKKVSAEVVVPDALLHKRLHTDTAAMCKAWRTMVLGGVMSGTLGVQGHYANALAAIYIATGQDAACVSESATGVTRMEAVDGGLYASVTLPDLIVGTVGGGTKLPTQRACLRLLGVDGDGGAKAFAELCAAVCLAGELSIVGALTANEFARAHRKLARGAR